MATNLAERALGAFVDDNFQVAVDLFTQAINLDPTNADLFADRAQANIKLNNFTEAIADLNKAIELDSSLAKAYLRKGMACFKLEEYHTAKAALETGASLAPNDSRFTKLIKECDKHIADEASNMYIDSSANVTPVVEHVPVGSQFFDKTAGNLEETRSIDNASHQINDIASVEPKYRYAYYQKPEEVVVTIFAKGIPPNNVAVDFGEQILSVTINIPGETKYHFQPRLFGKIVPDKCRYDVLSTKVEICLAKAEAINWTSLEYSKEVTIPQRLNVSTGDGIQRPRYPSSKSKASDWDKLEALVKEEEKEEKLDGDAALSKLFGDIYKNADEDMRRAMTKSFVESNGTVLSTNWKEVGPKKVETSPPDGMELKRWEY